MDYIRKEESSKTINTLSARLELYVDELMWKKANKLSQDLLNSFILYAKDEVEKMSINMMNTRFNIIKEKDINLLNEGMKNIRVFNPCIV